MSREAAWRVFSAEFSSSRVDLKGEGEKAPSYIVTPLGAMINRMLIAGVLTDSENTGTDDEPMWRARITDPTGTFYINATRYQPEAAAAISKISVPSFVAIVGKARAYSPEEGKFYVSVRPEKVIEVDSDMRDHWVLETCKSTLNRIEAMNDAMSMEDPTVESLMDLEHPWNLSKGIVESLNEYGPPDLNRYRAMVLDALKYLLPGMDVDIEIPESQSDIPEEIDIDLDEGRDIDKEEEILDMIDRLDTGGKGAPWEGIVEEAEKMKIGKTELEELTNSLLDKGLIYEPVLGRMKRI